MNTPTTQAKRTKTALVLARRLELAANAMGKFIHACVDDGDRHPYADDQRVTMQKAMLEYSGWLESVHQHRCGALHHIDS
jgi:hypothetical protein